MEFLDFQKLLKHYLKSEIAFRCNLEDTRSIDMWVSRKVIPKKYHSILMTLLKEL